jgi:hypothetical protein
VAKGWTRLHNEELHNFYTSQNVTKIKCRMKGGECSTDWRDENFIQYFG